MATITFDTHKFIRTLGDAGIPEAQAEAIADAFSQAHIEAEVATKTDLRALEMTLRAEMRELEYRLTFKLGGMLVAAVGIVAALVKLL